MKNIIENEHCSIKIVNKPWGREVWIADRKGLYLGKELEVNAGEELSYQYHDKKDETMIVVAGECVITFGDKKYKVSGLDRLQDRIFIIPPKKKHKVKAITDTLIYEISTWNPRDTVRLKDKYNRIKKK